MNRLVDYHIDETGSRPVPGPFAQAPDTGARRPPYDLWRTKRLFSLFHLRTLLWTERISYIAGEKRALSEPACPALPCHRPGRRPASAAPLVARRDPRRGLDFPGIGVDVDDAGTRQVVAPDQRVDNEHPAGVLQALKKRLLD